VDWKRQATTCTFVALILGGASSAAAQRVSSVSELRTVIDLAEPGDVITLESGSYAVGSKISVTSDGTEREPIVLRADSLGDVTLEIDTLEGFVVNASHWRFENLDITGVCADHSNCEHALHLVGRADGTVIRNSRLRDFNAQIKGNGSPDGPNGERVWPDDVVIERNEFFDSEVRETGNPVTKIDVVGGRRWVVRGNFIHDFAKGGGNNVSYAAFLKGHSRDGLFARNLVACSMNHSGQVRLGLSFGGGGTGSPEFCDGESCTPEHQNGVMRNNIVVNCSDAGIFLNESKATTLVNNTVVDTLGIDVRFEASDAEIRNNLSTDRIKDRDGGSSTRSSNLNVDTSTLEGWFPDPLSADFSTVTGEATSGVVNAGETVDVRYDYCGELRDDGAVDIGAVEYFEGSACDTTVFGHDLAAMSGGDAGTADAGAGDAGAGDAAAAEGDAFPGADTRSGSSGDGEPVDSADLDSSFGGGEGGCSVSRPSEPGPARLFLAAMLFAAAVCRRIG